VRHIEHEHQKALITWAARMRLPPAPDVQPGATVFDYLLAIPNGGRRWKAEAARLKAEGVKAGASDLLLPLRRHGFGGLWLELKAPGVKKPTDLQADWIARMRLAGYRAEWRAGWLEGAAVIAEYCGIAAPALRLESAAAKLTGAG
jgi:hypothetical protein